MPAHVEPAARLDELAKAVLQVSRSPDDEYEVAAILESMGWTDETSSRTYGTTDVFDLARQLWPVVKMGVLVQGMEMPAQEPWLVALGKNIRNFLRGTMFAAPMLLSVGAMLTLRFSLWSYMYFSVDIATAIALGTIGSFAVTGGFTQAIARRGLMYTGQSEYGMARRMTFMLIRVGVVVAILIGVALLLLDLVFPIFPARMMTIMILYYAFLCGIWLSLTVFYMLQRELVFTALVALGIAIVYVFHEIFGLSIIPSQVIALSVIAAVGIVLALYFFVKEERNRSSTEQPQMPRLSIVAYTVLPYFAYGVVYFTFLFVDRVLAWSSHDIYMPYVVWFRGEYELGMDYAMAALVFPLGVVEDVIRRFSEGLIVSQKSYSAARGHEFDQLYTKQYTRNLISYAAMSWVSGLVVWAVVDIIYVNRWFADTFYTSAVTMFVFRWGIVGYCILAASLMNCLVLFSLSVPGPVLNASVIALIVDVGLGFVLSRLVTYTWAVFGFVVGAAVFAFLTTRAVRKVLKNLDFYLYAAS